LTTANDDIITSGSSTATPAVAGLVSAAAGGVINGGLGNDTLIGGNGADTLFGAAVPGRANSIGQVATMAANNLKPKCILGKQHYKNYIPAFDPSQNPLDNMPCFQNGDVYNSFVGTRLSDMIQNQSIQL
jgi:hypothetical protein